MDRRLALTRRGRLNNPGVSVADSLFRSRRFISGYVEHWKLGGRLEIALRPW
jgi:hypothetical protein